MRDGRNGLLEPFAGWAGKDSNLRPTGYEIWPDRLHRLAEMAKETSLPLRDAVAETARAAEREQSARKRKRGGRPSDVFGGEIRRRDVFPLLVLHLIRSEPSYGNHLIDAIEEMTQGVISVN